MPQKTTWGNLTEDEKAQVLNKVISMMGALPHNGVEPRNNVTARTTKGTKRIVKVHFIPKEGKAQDALTRALIYQLPKSTVVAQA